MRPYNRLTGRLGPLARPYRPYLYCQLTLLTDLLSTNVTACEKELHGGLYNRPKLPNNSQTEFGATLASTF